MFRTPFWLLVPKRPILYSARLQVVEDIDQPRAARLASAVCVLFGSKRVPRRKPQEGKNKYL